MYSLILASIMCPSFCTEEVVQYENRHQQHSTTPFPLWFPLGGANSTKPGIDPEGPLLPPIIPPVIPPTEPPVESPVPAPVPEPSSFMILLGLFLVGIRKAKLCSN